MSHVACSHAGARTNPSRTASVPTLWNVTAHGPVGRWLAAIARIVGGVGAGDRAGWLAWLTWDGVAVGPPVGAGACVVGGMHAPMSRPSASANGALRPVISPTPTYHQRSVDPTR